MKKQLYLFGLLFIPFTAFSQNVGIDKSNPQAKLEIKQTTNLEPTLMLSDSIGNYAGRLRFRSLFSQYSNRSWYTDYKAGVYSKDSEIFLYNDSTNVMNIYGTGNITIGDAVAPTARLSVLSDNPTSDILDVMGSSYQSAFKILGNRNVGIKNPAPAEALDVTGNINVTGTIKANGVDGTPNQVLMKNSSGSLAWGDITEFKNHVTFRTVGSSTWTVPAGVIRIWVEAWAGGGGASQNGGGGGGGYVTAIFTVTPAGTVTYTVGDGGAGAAPSGISGIGSSVSFGAVAVVAFGGGGDNSGSTLTVASGGGFNGTTGTGYNGWVGEQGGSNQYSGYQINATTFRENQTGGKGGNGGNTINTGGKGASLSRDASTLTVNYGIFGGNGTLPGGGGGSWGTWGGIFRNGAQGLVIIHY